MVPVPLAVAEEPLPKALIHDAVVAEERKRKLKKHYKLSHQLNVTRHSPPDEIYP